MPTVRAGDTLSAIAARHSVSLQSLISANPQIKNPNLIYPGQALTLPGQSDTFQPAPARTSSSGATYTVRSGDTLGAIGARYGVSYQAIAAANGIANPNFIQVGQQLRIPGAADSFTPAPVTQPSPAASGARYTVQPGDSLSGIGARFGVSYQSIAAANGITNPNRIYPGQVLTIPGASSTTGPAPIAPVPGATSGGVSVDQLTAIMPTLSRARAAEVLPHLNSAMAEANINTPLRQAAFLAQLAHESGGLRWFEEIASGAAYEGRADLGNTQPGDGVRYKGRGPIQLTGRANYRAAGNALGINLEGNPSRAADLDVGFRTAAWYWGNRNLNAYADARNFDAITYRVNGGYNGKASRDTYYQRALSVLGA